MRTADPLEDRDVIELFAGERADERAGFRDDLRSRLLVEVGAAATARRPSPWWAIRVPRPVLAAFAIVAMLFGGSGLAAAGSLPGEPLFELKRAAEEVALAVAFDDETRLERLADQASARIAELRRAPDGAAKAAAAVESARALERLAEAQRGSSTDAGSPASETVESARDQAESVLRDLELKLPVEAADGIRRAIEAGRPADRGPNADRTPKPSGRPSDAPRASPPGRSSDAPGRASNAPARPTAAPGRAPGRPSPSARESLGPNPSIPKPPADDR